MIEHGLDVWGSVASVIDVAQVVQTAEKTPGWLGGTLGFAVVMTALSSISLATSVVGAFFVKRDAAAKGKSAPGKTEGAPKAPAAAQASAAAGDDIPLAAIIAAAAYTVSAMGQQLRNVVVQCAGPRIGVLSVAGAADDLCRACGECPAGGEQDQQRRQKVRRSGRQLSERGGLGRPVVVSRGKG